MNDNPSTNENPEPTEAAAPVVNPREEAMAAIERQNNERIAKELGITLDDVQGVSDGDIDTDPADIEAEAERKRLEREAEQVERQSQLHKQLQPGAAAEQPATEPTVLENFDNVMVKTKVDGAEVMRPLSELVRIGQKEAAVNKRLEQAAQMRQEAERLLAQAQQGTPGAEPQKTTVAPASNAAPTGKEFLDAIYAGEEDKALAAIQQLLGTRRDDATSDTQSIARQVKAQIETEAALDSFGGQYPEIVADPYLADVADRYLAAELEMGTPFRDALSKAGNATRDWLKQKAGSVGTPTTPTTLSEKRTRKQSIDHIPSIHATAATSREPAPQTVADVLDEMRKARGLV